MPKKEPLFSIVIADGKVLDCATGATGKKLEKMWHGYDDIKVCIGDIDHTIQIAKKNAAPARIMAKLEIFRQGVADQ